MSFPRRAVAALLLTTSGAVAACTVPDRPVDVFDPYEAQNRATHELNRTVDRAIVRPAAQVYGDVLPPFLRRAIGNFADNIALTGDVVNDILQGRGEDAGHNFFRFAVNTTLGVGGLFDPAGSSMGLERRETGFGETLYTWGVPEGAYYEIPFLGPSTEREAVGRLADFFTNVVVYALEGPSALAATGAGVADGLDTRYRLRDTIDGVLYESADSYAQSRTLYLQNMRFRYSGGQIDEQAGDIYDDLIFE